MKAKNNFVTFPQLQTVLDILEKKLSRQIKALDKKIAGLPTKDDIWKFKDDIVKELVKIRESNEILIGQYPEMRDNLEVHETRIGKLETAVFAD